MKHPKKIWYEIGLRGRIALLLALALVPIGLLGAIQTYKIARADMVNKSAVVTNQIQNLFAEPQRVFFKASADAKTIASLETNWIANAGTCNQLMQAVVDSKSYLVSAMITDHSGTNLCSSKTVPSRVDVTGLDFQAASAHVLDTRSAVLTYPILNASNVRPEPHLVRLEIQSDFSAKTLNGEIVGVVWAPNATQNQFIPEGVSAANQARLQNLAIPDQMGTHKIDELVGSDGKKVAFIPILESNIFGVAVLPTESAYASILNYAPLFAALLALWLGSIFIAWVSVNKLVIQPLNGLRTRMRNFADTRDIPNIQTDQQLQSRELRQMDADFHHLARSLLDDQRDLHRSVQEKNTLLKEVHHRVKNNLQLISSMMNIQMRRSISDETKQTLGRLQDRIMALATTHKRMYLGDDIVQINAAAIVSDVAEQIAQVGSPFGRPVKMTTDLEEITVFPEQAFALSLLVSEVVTNAIKNIDMTSLNTQDIKIELHKTNADYAQLKVTNPVNDQNAAMITNGIGTQLIEAFTQQLGGQVTRQKTSDRYILTLSFPIDLVKARSLQKPNQSMAAQ